MLGLNMEIKKGTNNERAKHYEDGLESLGLLASLQRWQTEMGERP